MQAPAGEAAVPDEGAGAGEGRGEGGGEGQHPPGSARWPAVCAQVTPSGDWRANPRGAIRAIAVALAAALTLSVAGCASRPEPDPAQAAARLALDRERLQAEVDAAVAVPGRRVCRERRLGLVERETERGIVIRDPQGHWRVRTEAGSESAAQGVGWQPCR